MAYIDPDDFKRSSSQLLKASAKRKSAKRKERLETKAESSKVEQIKTAQKAQEEQDNKSLLEKAGDLGKGLWEGLTSSAKQNTRGGASMIDTITGASDKNFQEGQDAIARDLKTARDKLKKGGMDEAKTARWKEHERELVKSQRELFSTQSENTKKEIENLDPVKNAAAAASTGVDLLTLGTGGAALKGTKAVGTSIAKGASKEVIEQGVKKVSGKIAQGAFEGGIAGGLNAVQENSKDLSVGAIAKGTAIGATIGAALPVGGTVVSKSKAAANDVTQKVAQNLIDNGSTSRAITQVGESGLIGAVDKAVSRSGKKLTYAVSDMLGSNKVTGKVLDMKDGFMSKMFTDMAPVYKTLKRSDFEGRTTGAHIAAREAVGNSNRALSYASDFIDNNESMNNVVAGITEKSGNDVIAGRKAFDEYAKAKSEYDLHLAGKKEFTPEKVAQIEKDLAKAGDFQKEYESLVTYYKDINDFRLKEGLMSEEDYNRFLEEPFDYVRQQREIPDWMKDKPAKKGKGSVASITQSDGTQARNKYAAADLLSPMETAIKTAQMAHVEAYRNRAAKTITDLLSEAGEARVVRSTDIVREKQALLADMASTRPESKKMARMLKTQNKQLRRLQAELNKLNKEGMNIRLKEGGNNLEGGFSPEGLGGQVPTSKAGKEIGSGLKPERPAFLKESYQDPESMVKDYAKMLRDIEKQAKGGQLLREDYNAGYTGDNPYKRVSEHSPFYREYYKANGKPPKISDYQELARSELEAGKAPYGMSDDYKSLAADNKTRSGYNQLLDSKERMDAPLYESKLGPKDTKAFLNALVAEDPAGIRKIRKMIEGRNTKLEPLLDRVELLSRDLDDLYKQRSGVWNQANATKTTVDKGGMTSLSFLDDGIENVVKVDPAVAGAVHAWGKQQTNVMNNFLRMTNNIFKYGTTTANVGFALPNFVADQMSSAINSKAVMSTHNPRNFVHSLFMTMGRPLDDVDARLLSDYNAGNKGQLSINQYDRTKTGENIANDLVIGGKQGKSLKSYAAEPSSLAPDVIEKAKRSGRKAYTYIKNPKTGFRKLKDGVDTLIGKTEEATRLQNYRGTYKKALKDKMSTGDAKILATQAARENSVDFLEMGDWGRVLNSIIPYFNAGLQGSRTMLRNAAERPTSFAAKTAVVIGMPVAATTIWNTGSKERRDIYATIPDYVKENNLVVIGPGAKWNDKENKWDGVYILKKPPGYKEFAEPVRKFIEYKADQPDSGLMDFFKDEGGDITSDFANALSPVDFSDPNKFLSSVTPQVLKPTAQAITNKDFFTGQDIVSQNLLDLPPEDQKYQNYSKLTAAIAGQFNTSPLKVDKWIKDTFGELGTNAVNTGDRMLGGSENNVDPLTGETYSDIGGRSLKESVTRRFVGAPGGQANQDFFKAYNPVKAKRTKTSSEVTNLIKQGRVKEAKRRADAYNESLSGKFGEYYKKYGSNPSDDEMWNEILDGLFIKTSERAFKARKKQ